MKTYTINGFEIKVSEKQNSIVNKLRNEYFNEALKINDMNLDIVKEKEQTYLSYVYNLYKEAIMNGKAKKIDSHFVIHANKDGRFVDHLK